MCCCPSSSLGTPSYSSSTEPVTTTEPSSSCLVVDTTSPMLLDDWSNSPRETSLTGEPKDILLWMRKTIVLRMDIESIRNCGNIHDDDVVTIPASSATDRKRVRFEHVNVRYYSQVLGNNPACREGAPMELSWDFFDERQLPIEDFDAKHRRHRNDFKLTALQRSHRLSSLGYTRQQVIEAQRTVLRVQRQRRATRAKLASFVGRWHDRLQERTEAFYAASAVSIRDHKTRRKISPSQQQQQQQPLTPPPPASTKSCVRPPKSAQAAS